MSNQQPEKRDLVAAFEAAYSSTPAWDIGHPKPAFAALARDGRLDGDAPDVGCGTGEHALMATQPGATPSALTCPQPRSASAEAKAQERGTSAQFVVGEALHPESLGEQFDLVLDCGLFHIFEDGDRRAFVESLARVVRTGGRYLTLCFSDEEPPGWGPRRITQAEIRGAFAPG